MTEHKSIGSRAQVMHGTANKTSGGLTKSQLKYNKQGKIVSRKASALAKKNNRLVKAGYKTYKGVFGVNMSGGDNISNETQIRFKQNSTSNTIHTMNARDLYKIMFRSLDESISNISNILENPTSYNITIRNKVYIFDEINYKLFYKYLQKIKDGLNSGFNLSGIHIK